MFFYFDNKGKSSHLNEKIQKEKFLIWRSPVLATALLSSS